MSSWVRACLRQKYRRQHVEKAARSTTLGQAISYRFKRDAKGWRGFVSTQMMDVPMVTDQYRGSIGIDPNAWRLPLVTYGRSTRQVEAIINDAVAGVVQYAKEVGKPIVVERLDFRRKKAALWGQRQSRRRKRDWKRVGKGYYPPNNIDHGRGGNIGDHAQVVVAIRMYCHNLAQLLILAKLDDRDHDSRGNIYGPKFMDMTA